MCGLPDDMRDCQAASARRVIRPSLVEVEFPSTKGDIMDEIEKFLDNLKLKKMGEGKDRVKWFLRGFYSRGNSPYRIAEFFERLGGASIIIPGFPFRLNCWIKRLTKPQLEELMRIIEEVKPKWYAVEPTTEMEREEWKRNMLHWFFEFETE